MSTASASTASPLPLPPALPAMDSFTSNSSGADSASDPTDLYDPDTDNPLLADDVFAARMSYSGASRSPPRPRRVDVLTKVCASSSGDPRVHRKTVGEHPRRHREGLERHLVARRCRARRCRPVTTPRHSERAYTRPRQIPTASRSSVPHSPLATPFARVVQEVPSVVVAVRRRSSSGRAGRGRSAGCRGAWRSKGLGGGGRDAPTACFAHVHTASPSTTCLARAPLRRPRDPPAALFVNRLADRPPTDGRGS